MIKLKEKCHYFSGIGPLPDALNTPNFRGSLKEAYGGKSMSLPIESRMRYTKQQESDSDDYHEDVGLDRKGYQTIEKHLLNGYKITRKDEKANLVTLERADEIKCRGRRPQYDKFRQTTNLQWNGRVKIASKKNA